MAGMPDLPEEFFQRGKSPAPLVTAVEQLCRDAGCSIEHMEQRTPSEIFELARDHYGSDLPEFWRIWEDWHESDEIPPMGDL